METAEAAPAQVEQQEQPDSEDELEDGLVIFQCITCREIIGDSMSFVCANDELDVISLQNVCSVSQSKETHTSNQKLDFGSTFQELYCKECQGALGKYYLTTPRHLDTLREMYTLSINSLKSYEVGQNDRTAPAERTSTHAKFLRQAAPGTSEKNAQICTELSQDMSKVKNLMLVIDDRLQHLEETRTQ